MTRAEMILRSVVNVLDQPPSFDRILREREELETLVPLPPEQVEDILDGVGDVFLPWLLAEARDVIENPTSPTPESSYAASQAFELVMYACIEAGRALQQAETPGLTGLVNAVSVGEGE